MPLVLRHQHLLPELVTALRDVGGDPGHTPPDLKGLIRSDTTTRVSGSRVPNPSSINRLSRCPYGALNLIAQDECERGQDRLAAAERIADASLSSIVMVDNHDFFVLEL